MSSGSSHQKEHDKSILEDLPFGSFKDLLFSYRLDQRPFVTFYDQGVEIRRHTYASYVALVRRCATFLAFEFGLTSHERVVVAMTNSDHQLIIYGALLFLEATIVPVNPAETDEYVEKLRQNADANLVLSDTKRSLAHVHFCDLQILDRYEPINQDGSTSSLDSLALLVSTSGTTNQPKLVCLNQRNLFANMLALKEFHHLNRDSIHACVLPLFHVNAFGFSFLTLFFVGGTLILNRRFHKESFWQILADTDAHTVNVVPEIVQRLVDQGIPSTYTPSQSLKYVVSAASPLTKDQFKKFQEIFHVSLIQGYGLSEAVNFSLVTPPELTSPIYRQLLVTESRPPVGIPIPGNEVEVSPDNGGGFLAARQSGELVIRGVNVMTGYYNNVSATEHVLKNGWLFTGDRGYFVELEDGQRLFFITGRIKNVAKRNSESICLEEIEDQIKLLDRLQDIAVVGFPNDHTGEEIGLVIAKTAETPPVAEIERILRTKLPYYKRPKIIKIVDAIPKTGSFKVQRRLLVELFHSQCGTKFSDKNHS